ncbi:hypothetical protein DD238_003506 [Peronospora effusa]|uniref:Uncharacterized protein n=1 Tax=Peronospora effusa TaxID=542832 RepID=A0A3M6VLR1_9STRA|nr:hypothetical protein DD238_003506 [Peronospora effusa]RQM10851.1 hypothetical protein DD237_004637 [Peronospora effusa]
MDAALPKCLIIMPEAKQTLTDLTDRIVSETLQTNENLYIDDRGLIGKKVKFCEQAHLKFAWTRELSRLKLLSNNAVKQHQRNPIAVGSHLLLSMTTTPMHSEGKSLRLCKGSGLAKMKPFIAAMSAMDGSIEDRPLLGIALRGYSLHISIQLAHVPRLLDRFSMISATSCDSSQNTRSKRIVDTGSQNAQAMQRKLSFRCFLRDPYLKKLAWSISWHGEANGIFSQSCPLCRPKNIPIIFIFSSCVSKRTKLVGHDIVIEETNVIRVQS